MKIAICDDDKSFVEKLSCEIREYISYSNYADHDFEFLSFIHPEDLLLSLKKYGKNYIDLLFLDISMPEYDGFDVAQICNELSPATQIVFISNYEERVFYSIRFNPLRFLCKSTYQNFLHEALNEALKKYVKKYNQIVFRYQNDLVSIPISHIIFLQKEIGKNYNFIYCTDTNRYKSRISQNEFMEKVTGYPFVKINSGTIVNMDYVKMIRPEHLVLFNDFELPVSRPMRAGVRQYYISYMEGK